MVVLFLWWRSRIFVYRKSSLIHPLRHLSFLNGSHAARQVLTSMQREGFPMETGMTSKLRNT